MNKTFVLKLVKEVNQKFQNGNHQKINKRAEQYCKIELG